MYIPPAFKDDDFESIRTTIRDARLANLVTATAEGPVATPMPLFLDDTEGEHGTLYGHLARANPQWHLAPIGDALAIFTGPEAYVTPSWYATKQETGKVVPTWNYIAVHAYGPVEFFQETERLLDVVTRLTNKHEGSRRAAAGHRRRAHPGRAVRGQAQDEPEPPRSRSRRRRGGACGE
jgi:transcriptional regulator